MKINELPQVIEADFLGEIEMTYKPSLPVRERTKVVCSQDIESYLRGVWSNKLEYVEEFLILCMNRANYIVGWAKISSGGVAGTVADPKIIFQVALQAHACSLALAHNHPSGQLKPSAADVALTSKLVEVGKALDLPVLDHIILTSDSYYSFADEGQI